MKILFYDIETAPLIGPAWQTWDTNLIWVIKEWYMLSFAYKWAGEKKVHVRGLPDYKLYKKEPENDRELVTELYKLFDEADVVIAHNGDRFDQKKTNARIIFHGLKPPTPYQSIDTLKIARKHFSFTSNKLNDLGIYLGCGQKLKTDSSLWQKCMAGDRKAWADMLRYNKQDVVLLEQVYNKLLPWITNHPSTNVYEGRPNACRNCGSDKIKAGMKYRATNTTLYQYFRCMGCGANLKSRLPEKGIKPLYV